MNYTLAAKLKLSGFPQKGLSGGFLLYPKEDENAPKEVARGTALKLSDIPMGGILWVDNSAYAPTLEELIEACGDIFRGLIREPQSDGRIMWWCESNHPHPYQNHTTPEEAVVALYIAIHQVS